MRRGYRRGRKVPVSQATVLAVAGHCGLGLFSWGCTGPGPEADAPLGWGPVDAREVRTWPQETLDAAPRWRVAQDPEYSMVLDSVRHVYGEHVVVRERRVSQGFFLPEGRVALLSSPGEIPPESPLLQLVDRAGGDVARIPPPRSDTGLSRRWESFIMAVTAEQGLVFVGNNFGYPQAVWQMGREGQDVWYADRDGRFTRPPSYIDMMFAVLLGILPDGSLVMSRSAGPRDTTVVFEIVSVRPTGSSLQGAEGQQPEVLFRVADPRGADGHEFSAAWSPLRKSVTVVAGDTIWNVPTERPELVAVHRSGDVLLRVEWEAGDRSVPPEAESDYWKGAERFPAAAELLLGADGLLYVRRWEVMDGKYPVRGSEWLVFTKAGDLVARLDMSPHWPSARVLAFDHEAVLVRVSGDDRPGEVRIHAIERQPG